MKAVVRNTLIISILSSEKCHFCLPSEEIPLLPLALGHLSATPSVLWSILSTLILRSFCSYSGLTK